MSWISGAEWIRRRKAGTGLCDKIRSTGAPAQFGAAASEQERCDRVATEIVVVGIRYAPRCPEHATEFRETSPEALGQQCVVMAALLNHEEPLLG